MADTTLQHRGYLGSIETSVEDRCFYGRVLFINDLVSYEGASFDELEKDFVASVDRYIADCEASGKPPNRPCSGVFQVRIGPELHREASQAAARDRVNLNEFVIRAIRRYVTNPRAIDINHHHDHAISITVYGASDMSKTLTGQGVADRTGEWQDVRAAVH